MKHIQTFESFLNESLNEGKMVINPMMDKDVKTPYGKGGPRTTVVLGKTSSGLAVTLNGDFVDTKKNMYLTNPTPQDKEEAQEMIQFHHDRLTGGINKEKLADLLANGLNEGFSGPSMLTARGVFDDEVISYTWEAAATWAFGQNLGLKGAKIDKEWNSQLDDSKSDLFKEVVTGLYSKGVSDIERKMRDAGNTADAIKAGVQELGDRLASLKGIFAGADKAPSFAKLQKEALAYADKLGKDTPLEPAEITIMPGVEDVSKGIKAKDYYEASTMSYNYDVMITMKDGKVMKNGGFYESEADVDRNPMRISGDVLAKVKAFLSKYQKAVDDSDDMATSYRAMNSVKLIIVDNEKKLKDIGKADRIISKKVIPALKKEFSGVEITF
jgi:hypothetical protein